MENKLSKRFGRRIRRNVEGRTGVGWGTRIPIHRLKTAGNLGVFHLATPMWEHCGSMSNGLIDLGPGIADHHIEGVVPLNLILLPKV